MFEDRFFGRSVISAKATVHRESALIALKVVGAGFQPARLLVGPITNDATKFLPSGVPSRQQRRLPEGGQVGNLPLRNFTRSPIPVGAGF